MARVFLMPLLGSIHLAGLTLSQAASRLTDMYGKDYLVNPKVNVMLIGYAKRRFTMLGQVNRPGSYEMPDGSPEGIELLEAIAMAGGYTRIAAPEKVSIKRNNKVMRVDAKRQARGGHDAFTVCPETPSPSAKAFFEILNGSERMSDIEGGADEGRASERGQRASFKN